MTLAFTPSPPSSPPYPAAANAPPAIAPGPGEHPLRFKRVCAECGTDFRSAKRHAAFCGDPCKRAWNNRRATRGAVVYDLLMALRHERKLATTLKVWSLLCRLAQAFAEEDHLQRAGRKSWRSPADVIAERPWLHSVRLGTFLWNRPDVR